MFIDWLTISQEHDHDLPIVCDVFTLTIDANTNEVLSTRQPRFKHEASFSTSVSIHVQGRKIRVEGNPSRVGRLDNLFGFTSIEQCVSVYNSLLREYGLPAFTRCTRLDIRQGESGAKSGDRIADGAKIERIDLTTNVSLGEGNVTPPLWYGFPYFPTLTRPAFAISGLLARTRKAHLSRRFWPDFGYLQAEPQTSEE